MNLYFFTQVRLCRINGIVWSTPAFSMPLWNRYLQMFDHVFVVARVTKTDSPIAEAMAPIEDNRVSFIDLPYYVGPKEYLKQRKQIDSVLESLVHPGDAYLCRVPGRIGSMAVKHLRQKHIPYGLEVVGDPWESMSSQAIKHMLSPVFQIHGYWSLRRLTRHAATALYVTTQTLQRKYPVAKGVFSTGASNVIIRQQDLSDKPHYYTEGTNPVRILAAGTLAQLYKAPDIVVKAIAEVLSKGYNVSLTWLGGGQYKEPMERLAQSLGIDKNVIFKGAVSHDEVRREMECADLFVHASRAEGLPRALIEAMAKGLPAIGTTVAGIPELLDNIALIPANSVRKLSHKIIQFISTPELMQKQAARNLAEAAKYHEDILQQRRLSFYEELKKVSETNENITVSQNV